MTQSGSESRGFSRIPEALDELKQGKIVIVVDDEDRENEGDFVCAAEFVNSDVINFMAKHGCPQISRTF